MIGCLHVVELFTDNKLISWFLAQSSGAHRCGHAARLTDSRVSDFEDESDIYFWAFRNTVVVPTAGVRS